MAKLLVIDDNETIRDGLVYTIKKMGHAVFSASSGDEGVEVFKKNGPFDFVMTDLKMDGLSGVEVLKALKAEDETTPVLIMTGFGTVETAVEAMKLGAFDFLTKPFAPEVVRLKVESALQLSAAKRQNKKLVAENDYLKNENKGRYKFAQLIGQSEPMQKIFRSVEKVAKTNSVVFVHGESGTGKELVARAIHSHSDRKDEPFIKVNCGAITETLLESELFGHEKGAFTGAIKTKLGRFELAHKGTLFLDEIGDVSAAMQVKLLRALQEQEFERVGGEKTIRVDVRVVSATNKDLEEEVKKGNFREDLFYRLHVVPLKLPPLRERRDDVSLLVQHFIEKLSPKINRDIRFVSDNALSRLVAYHWPGNIRELENTIEQSLVFATGNQIEVDALPSHLASESTGDELTVPKQMSLPDILEDLEKQLILKAFKESKNVKTETARKLGIKTSALYYKLEKYGIQA